MTSKQILDSFSETLMQDERIFSLQERALVVTLLQHARSATAGTQEMRDAVRAVIASAVGETVAQRAFAVLGANIVERILEESELPFGEFAGTPTTEVLAGHKQSHSPSKPMKGPGPPSPSPSPDPESPGRKGVFDPESPGKPMKGPGPPSPSPDPESPGAKLPLKDPESPGRGQTATVVAHASVGVAERPETLPAKCVVLDEFLAPEELEKLTHFTLQHEADFHASEVVSPSEEHGVVNYEHRRSRVLMDLAEHEAIILDRIKAALPLVLEKLGMEEFAITNVEAQITASNDGDYFHFHCDNTSEKVRSRHLTFVYFFHREPREFEGGELRIHDARLEDGSYISEGSYQTIVPQQNQIVFFPCELLHEITPVRCPSQHFADSRFTLNGWLHQ